jgi:hypothetical protein
MRPAVNRPQKPAFRACRVPMAATIEIRGWPYLDSENMLLFINGLGGVY